MIDDYKAALEKVSLDDFEKEKLLGQFRKILTEYRDHFGEETEVRLHLLKRFGRHYLIMGVKGGKWDCFEEGEDVDEINTQRKVSSLSIKRTSAMSYYYLSGYNVCILSSSFFKIRTNILKQPIIWAIILGAACGLICQILPQPANDFIVNDVVSPILDIVLKMMAGIMGPVIFLSLVTAINTLESINELNQLGFKLVLRFLYIVLFCTLLSGIVGIVLFGGLAEGAADFKASMIVKLLLSIIPTSLITPFTENNIPQLVVLGMALGAILLMFGERTRGLANILQQVKEWINELLNLVLKIVVVIPFLSIFKLLAKGDMETILKGWKFIVGVYICFVICLAVKMIRVSVKCKIRLSVLLRVVKPLTLRALSTGSSYVCMRKFYEISKEDLQIHENFTSFWVPMSQAMLWPTSPVKFILASFSAAMMTGTPVSLSFLLILFIVVIELSLASPGFAAGCTIIFPSLGISAELAGIFTAYNVLISNAGAAFDITYQMLEQIQAANVLNKIDKTAVKNA